MDLGTRGAERRGCGAALRDAACAELLARRGGDPPACAADARLNAERDPPLGVHAAALLPGGLGLGARLRRRRGGPALALGALRQRDDRAARAAFNPLLIWYSQEARAYALLVALCALSLWCLLRGDWRGWAIAAALALATHYFAVFIVGPELGWLGWRHARDSKAAAWSAGFVVAVAAALLPLALAQAGGNRAGFIHSTALAGRVAAA